MITRFRTLIALAFAGVLATLVLAPSAPAATKKNDCHRVAAADYKLCQQVRRQLAYAYATEGGLNQVVGGKALVHEITHQGLTKAEMRSYLRGEALNYTRYALTGSSIIVNTGTMRKYYGADAHYEVHTQGPDVAVSIVQP